MIRVEIAVEDLEGARRAVDAGADRIELCAQLSCGGLTPTPALVEAVVRLAGSVPVRAMVRCRAGSFVYIPDEVSVMEREVEALRSAGAAGLVFGAVTERGLIDTAAVKRLIEAANGLPITFHRAFDVAGDWREALAQVADLGVDRVLTSGGANRAEEGLDRIAALVSAQSGVVIMAGAGISSGNVERICAVTGVSEVHASARRNPHEFSSQTRIMREFHESSWGVRTLPDPDEARELIQRARSTKRPT